MGVRALRFLQLGKETTAGTAVAATTIWRGLGTIQDAREVVFPQEDVGFYGGVDRTYIPRLVATLDMDSVPATFEQLPYLLEGGVKLVNTGTQDSTGSGYVYTYTFPTTAANTIRTFTIEGGDDVQAEEMEYAFVSDFGLAGAGGEAVMMTATWQGKQVTNTTKTGSLGLPVVEDVLFGNTSLYIDAASGTMGTTQVSQLIMAFDLSVRTGITPVYGADGLGFMVHQFSMPEIMLNATFLHNAPAVTEKGNWRNQTARQIRLDINGTALTTAGNFTTKKVRIDLAGKWESFDKIGEQDGNDIIAATFRARYNATAAKYAEIKVVNQLTVLP